jgi:hypothetical protein
MKDFGVAHSELLADVRGVARLAFALLGLTLEELASDRMPDRAAERLASALPSAAAEAHER